MTLVLTWLFPFGIVMGADSAVTYTDRYVTDPSGRRKPRILTGITKLFEIPKIHAGISFWGKGHIGSLTTDVWLSDFIHSRENDYDNIQDFAVLLQDELRDAIPEMSAPEGSLEYRYGNRGFHLAGFVEHEERMIPTFYHIHNGQSEVYSTIDPRRINANQDFPPQRVSELFSEGIAPHTRNGDFFIYSALFDEIYGLITELIERSNRAGRRFVFPDVTKFPSPLSAFEEFVRFWIRIVRDFYALSSLPEIIGGEISILSIDPQGEINYSSRS